jgi:hypothetical protein
MPVGGETEYASSGSFRLKTITSSFRQGSVVPAANNHPAQATQAAALPQEPQPMPQVQYQPVRN